MPRYLFVAAVLLTLLAIPGSSALATTAVSPTPFCQRITPGNPPTLQQIPCPTATPSSTPTPSASATASASPSPSAEPESSPTPAASSTPAPSVSPSPTATPLPALVQLPAPPVTGDGSAA